MSNKNKPKRGEQRWFQKQYITGDYYHIRDYALPRLHHQSIVSIIENNIECFNHPDCILDIGCACGDFTQELSRLFSTKKAVGIDFVEEGLREAQARYKKLMLVRGRIPDIPLRDASVNMVALMEVLYYFNPKKQKSIIKELGRVLCREGHVVVSTNLSKTSMYMSDKDLRALFADDFELIDFSYEYFYLYHIFNRIIKRFCVAINYIGILRILSSLVDRVRRNVTLAIVLESLARIVVGRRAITNGIYIYRIK